MEIKHKNLLLSASIINALVGLFFIICAVFEFTGIIQTKANNVTETIGIQLSYLVLIGDVLILSSSLLSIFTRKTAALLNLQIILGIVALAWPMFLSISLLFTQAKINIRLVIMTLTALFYIISVLVVKITNDEFVKSHTFNPTAIINASGKRSQSVDVKSIFNHTSAMTSNKNIAQSVGNLAAGMNTHHAPKINVSALLKGRRAGNNLGFMSRMLNRHRRHNMNSLGKIFNGRRPKGRRFRFPK